MKHDIKKYTVTIFDTTYTVRSNEHEEHIQRAAEQVDFYMKEISLGSSGLDQKTIAVLAALKFASRMAFLEFSIQERTQREQDLVDKITVELSMPASID